MRKIIPVAALALASIVLVGCNLMPQASTGTNASGTAGTNGSTNQTNTGGGTDSGNAKSAYWPSNIPTLAAGYDFSYAKLSDSYYLSYKVSTDKDAKSIGDDIKAMMVAAGWTLPDNSVLESDNAVVQTYTNADSSTTLSVSKDDNTTNIYSVSIISGPKTN